MSADVATIVLQGANFLLSFLILRKWLFMPVMRAMDERKARLAAELAAARAEREEAARLRADLEKRRAALKRETAAALEREEARLAELHEEKARALNEAMASKWARFDAQIEGERAAVLAGAAGEASRAVVAIAARALASVSGISLEEALVAKFAELFAHGKAEGLVTLRKFYKVERALTLASSFPLSQRQKKELKAALAKALKTRAPVIKFAMAKDLVCALRVECGSLEMLFGADNYIERLKGEMNASKAS